MGVTQAAAVEGEASTTAGPSLAVQRVSGPLCSLIRRVAVARADKAASVVSHGHQDPVPPVLVAWYLTYHLP